MGAACGTYGGDSIAAYGDFLGTTRGGRDHLLNIIVVVRIILKSASSRSGIGEAWARLIWHMIGKYDGCLQINKH
jgi:hypothetical protein